MTNTIETVTGLQILVAARNMANPMRDQIRVGIELLLCGIRTDCFTKGWDREAVRKEVPGTKWQVFLGDTGRKSLLPSENLKICIWYAGREIATYSGGRVWYNGAQEVFLAEMWLTLTPFADHLAAYCPSIKSQQEAMRRILDLLALIR